MILHSLKRGLEFQVPFFILKGKDLARMNWVSTKRWGFIDCTANFVAVLGTNVSFALTSSLLNRVLGGGA